MNIESGPGDGSQQRDIIGLFPGDLKNGNRLALQPSIFIFSWEFRIQYKKRILARRTRLYYAYADCQRRTIGGTATGIE